LRRFTRLTNAFSKKAEDAAPKKRGPYKKKIFQNDPRPGLPGYYANMNTFDKVA
jgi:hypothetical protein